MRTVLACVRTPLAAQSIATWAARLGILTVHTAVSETEVLARLADRPADVILADTAVVRPDTVGFTRRVLARAPHAVLVLFGAEDPRVAVAAVAAGARGLVRGGEADPVGAVTKAMLLISLPPRPVVGGTAGGTASVAPSASTGPAPTAGSAPRGPNGHEGGGAAGAGAEGAEGAAPAVRSGPVSAPPDAGTPATDPMLAVVPAQRGDVAVPAAAGTATGGPPRRPRLTERELQVLQGMAEGRSNAEIGRELYVSEDTVKTHARRLFRKLGARDRAHAVAVGFRVGLLG